MIQRTFSALPRTMLLIPLVFLAIEAQSHAQLYGIGGGFGIGLGNLYSISTSTASPTLIGQGIYNNAGPGSLEWDPTTGQLLALTIGLDHQPSTSLYSINPADGSSTIVGDTNVPRMNEGALQFSPSGDLFGAFSGDVTNGAGLHDIDTSTGEAALVATYLGGDVNGLAWGPDGLVGLERISNSIVKIDENGDLTTLANVSGTVGSVGGMTNALGDSGYFVIANGDLFSFSVSTGTHSFIGNTGLRLRGLAYDASNSQGEICDANSQGDLDGNGTVAFADFLTLSANFGQPVSDHTAGDIDCDGTVAFADFLTLSANFGQAVGVGVSSVPEPSSSSLFAFVGSFVALLRRRRG